MVTKFLSGEALLQDIQNSLTELQNNSLVKSILMFSCDKNNLTVADYKILTDIDLPVFGGIFPQIIFNAQRYTEGTLLIGISEKPNFTVIENISNEETNFEEQLNERILDEDYKTLFVFIDGFASRIGNLIESLFNIYGIELNFLGGGAGSLDMVQKPCIITPYGLLEDAAILAAVKLNSGIGVKHGWQTLSGPYKVTHSIKNVIYMLENKVAFDVYKEVVESDSNQKISSVNFFDIAKGYPFGITKIGDEKIVRDPIMLLDDGSLVCVGDVPLNNFVHILKGQNDSLIRAADLAFINAREFVHPVDDESIIFIDCISRVLFLEESFQHELDSIGSHKIPVIGALTLGEIANSGKDFLEFYNKTAVVAIIQGL